MKILKNFLTVFDFRSRLYVLALVLGAITGHLDFDLLTQAAHLASTLFINLLTLVSLPIIFLSIVSTIAGMESLAEFRYLGIKVVKYTLLTTVIAASIALALFLFIDPVHTGSVALPEGMKVELPSESYLTFLTQSIPSNFVEPFLKGNVVGVLFIGIALSLSMLSLPDDKRSILHAFFSSLYAGVMKLTTAILTLMPIAVWAFVTEFVMDIRNGSPIGAIGWYLLCVLLANLLQAIVVLPLLLKWKGVKPLSLFKAMLPALSIAFFSKSSSAALPMALRCAEERGKISKKVANFAFPLCTTINMNACAAFILTTVLFVSTSHGMEFSALELGLWIILSTVAAVGNAGVPMGCFFLASAFLASMHVPLQMMGIILPFYALIDMLESAINVWSDSCVAATVQAEVAPHFGSVTENTD